MINRLTTTTLILLFLLIGITTACQETAQSTGPAQATTGSTPSATLPTTSLASSEIIAEGQLVPHEYISLAFPGSGKVVEIFVQKGSHVNPGDPLLQLDTSSLTIQHRQVDAQLASAQSGLAAAQTEYQLAQTAIDIAQAQVERAEANLILVQTGAHPEEISEAQSRLAAAEARVTEAIGRRDMNLNTGTNVHIQTSQANVAAVMAERQAVEDAYEQVFTSCYETPEGEVCPLFGPVEETLRAQLEAAQLRQTAAQAELDELLTGPSPIQQQTANSAVALAVANREVAQAELDLLLEEASPAEIDQAQIQVAQAQVTVATAEVGAAQAEAIIQQAEAALVAAQANLEVIQTALERTILRATIAGQVADVLVRVNQPVTPNQPVITIADFSEWVVQTKDLSELDMATLRIGSKVVVNLSAIPDSALSGQVEKIAFVAEQVQGDIVYEAIIALETSPDLPLRWGMTAFVRKE